MTYDVRFEHLRCSIAGGAYQPKHELRRLGLPIHCRGGVTICKIYDDAGNLLAEADAICNDSDNFCYRIGRDIAEGRARKQLEQRQEEQPTEVDPLVAHVLQSIGIDPTRAQELAPNFYVVELSPTGPTPQEAQAAAQRAFNNAQVDAKARKGLFF